MSRRLAAALLSVLFVCGVVFASLSLLKPQKPPDLPLTAVVHPALTRHLLFVIVDGLRYDLATNPERMPRFAEAMRRHRSAEVMAGPVSMTSAAIQNFASGQPGQLEQIARNLNPDVVAFNSWLGNARARGMSVAFVGDGTWLRMYGQHFDRIWRDPPGMAMDFDFTDATMANAKAALESAPNVLIVHFGVPDHQMHAHGVQSERYRSFLRRFDRKLGALLDQADQTWTVVVTSDHGANDAGDHGSDVPIQRRTPLYAYGPGIAPAAAEPSTAPLDQSDVAGTLAALVGVPAPAHSQGHLLTDWLDVPNEAAVTLAVNEVKRTLRFASAVDPAGSERLRTSLAALEATPETPRAALAAARRLGEEAKSQIAHGQGAFSSRALLLLLGIVMGSILMSVLWLGRAPAATYVAAALVALLSILLTVYVEKLPDAWPKRTSGALFVVFNLPTLLLLVRPERFLALLRRLGALAPVLVPGALAVAYPRNLQPVAFAVCVVVPLVILGSPSLSRWGISGLGETRPGRCLDLSLLILWAFALAPAGLQPNGLTGLGWNRYGWPLLGVSAFLLGTLVLELWRRGPKQARTLLLMAGAIAASVLLRRIAPPWLGRTLIVAVPLLALLALRRGAFQLGALGLLLGYAWASRDMELPTLFAALGIASATTSAAASLIASDRARQLTLLALWFSLAFTLRLGVSGGIDPTNLDMAAGAFGDPAVSLEWLSFCVIWKTLVALIALGVTVLAALPDDARSLLARSFGVIAATRVAVLLCMLQLANGSFWTSLRVIGELPYTMIFFVAAGLAGFASMGKSLSSPHAMPRS